MSIRSLSFLVFGFLLLQVSGAQATKSIEVESCREAGFDPWQLSCSTCELLPETVVSKCQSCCLSYKTLKKRTNRYQAAVLLNSGGNHEVDTLIDEDWDSMYEEKGQRLILKKGSIGGGMMMFQLSPSMIFWLDEIPPNGADLELIESKAVESIVLDGWKRDDMRDMLLALLPGKK